MDTSGRALDAPGQGSVQRGGTGVRARAGRAVRQLGWASRQPSGGEGGDHSTDLAPDSGQASPEREQITIVMYK